MAAVSLNIDYSSTVAGWKALVLENDELKVTILPEYGGWILSAIYKPRQTELLWRSPRGLLAKDDPPVVPESSLGFRAYSPGGWPELFPHGSGPAEIRGVKMPFHGEVVNRRWQCEILTTAPGEVAARLWVDCHLLPLTLERVVRLKAGQATLTLEEKVTNRSGIPIDFMWGHHPYFAKPLMSSASRIFAPAAQSLDDDFTPDGWPMGFGRDLSRCPAEGSASSEMFYLSELSEGWYALVNPEEKIGIAMAWDAAVFPYVWIWREANSSMNYPYFGGAYTVAIEPFSSLPGARARGERLLMLGGGESMATSLHFTAFQGLTEVAKVSPTGTVTGK